MTLTNIFSAYLRLEQLPDETKAIHKIKLGAETPRFDTTYIAGYYKPLGNLMNNKGQIVFYLSPTRGVVNSPDNRRADNFLMAKNSFNFSSIYLLNNSEPNDKGELIGYGNPNRKKIFGKKKITNPFFECKDDGFLFVISPDWRVIEVLIIPDGLHTILASAQALFDGDYNDALETMRATAKTFCQY